MYRKNKSVYLIICPSQTVPSSQTLPKSGCHLKSLRRDQPVIYCQYSRKIHNQPGNSLWPFCCDVSRWIQEENHECNFRGQQIIHQREALVMMTLLFVYEYVVVHSNCACVSELGN
jgi:hypothetical protein